MWQYYATIAVTLMLIGWLFRQRGLYNFETIMTWPRKMTSLVSVMTIILAVLAGLGFALKVSADFSRVWVFATFISATILMIVARGALVLLLKSWRIWGRFQRNVAIVGAGHQAVEFVEHLCKSDNFWINIIGLFDDRATRIEREVGRYSVIGDIDRLTTCARRGHVDCIVIALPWSADHRVLEIVQRLRELPVHVYLASDLVGYRVPAHSHESLSSVAVLKMASTPLTGWGAVAKLVEDRILAALLIILLSPIMLAIALAIKLNSPGPILFRQYRYGYNNNLIEVLKFRTMYHEQRDENAETLTTRGDTRITEVGRFLRRTSLDELPQLFNVMRGNMSIVGPRPHAISAKAAGRLYQDIVTEYAVRHKIKPGITGWAQVNGWRGETDTEEKIRRRVEYDIYYMENISILFDIKIVFRTITAVLLGRNAY